MISRLALSIVLNFLLVFFILYLKRDSIQPIIGRVLPKNSFVSEQEISKNNLVSEQEISKMNSEPYTSEVKTIGASFQAKKQILFLGNSISLHGLSKEVNWTHVSGMAASSEDKDYIHILVKLLSEDLKSQIEYQIVNIADFERSYSTFNYDRLSSARNFNSDLVVFQIGENVSSSGIDQGSIVFQSAYIKLVESIDSKSKVICLPFWPDKTKNRIITQVALETGSSLVDLSHIGSGLEPLNFARSENKYTHSGVAAHPGDYGMENIAKAIFSVARNIVR